MSKLIVNTSNFSAFFSSNSEAPINEIVRKNVITSKDGCNQIIRSIDCNRLFFLIPNIFIENTCNNIKKTFEEIINEFSLFGFKYRIHNSNNSTQYYFLEDDESVSNSTIIEINLEDCYGDTISKQMQHRYYAFCLIRHFYYYQNLLQQYYSIYDENDNLTMKMIKLSAAAEKINPSHTLFSPGINDLSTCPINVIKGFVNSFSNNNNKYKINTCIKSFENYPIQKIINERINSFYYNNIFNIDTPFILVSQETCKNLPDELQELIIPEYYIARIGHTSNGYIRYFMLRINNDIKKYFSKKRLADIPNYNNTTIINLIDKNGFAYQNLKFHKLGQSYNLASEIVDLIFDFNFQLYSEDLELINNQTKKYYVSIKSRHPSHNIFRKSIKSNKRVLVRFGSITSTNTKYDLVINNESAIQNSSNKYRMKTLFNNHNVITAEWTDDPNILIESEDNFPVIAKHINGSRGTGNYKLDTPQELNNFISRRNVSNYIFEKFKNYSKEYRIHVSREGVFLMWRKLRRLDTPIDQKWFFNNQNCNWVGEDHELFDTPKNIEEIKLECLKALNAVGLDIGACDVRVTSNDRKKVLYSIIEINSAPSMAERTAEAYVKEINKLIK